MTTHVRSTYRNLSLTRAAAMGALFLFAIALGSEAARAFGYTDTTPRIVRASFVLFTLLAIGAAIVEHFIAATRELARLNAELETRLAEKSERIKATYAHIEEVKREWTLVSERQRILADMHDGVGASLVGLLRYVQSGHAKRANIEQRVQEALQEMRIAIDALQPREGDLATVLGSLRYRLGDMIRSSGITLSWDVEELPDVGNLKPSDVFALQRTLLEAIANALKHSGARQVRLTARSGAASVEIRVEDDGRGFDAAQPAAGLGLASMRARAQRIGARLSIQSRPGGGTCVALSIPRAPGRAATRAQSLTSPGRSSPSSDARVTAAAPECTASLR